MEREAPNLYLDKENRYNEHTREIIKSKNEAVSNLFNIGIHLMEVKNQKLFLVEYKHFEEYLKEKVNIGRSTAFQCINIASEYSLDDFTKFGFSKLIELKKHVPDKEERKEVMDNISPAIPYREIGREASNYQVDKELESAEDIKNIHPEKEPITEGPAEKELKLLREGKELLEFADKLIWLKGTWSEKLSAWVPLATTDEEIIKLKHELLRKNEAI